MRILSTLFAYLIALAVVAAVAFFVVMFLAGPHSGLLPAWLESVVLIQGWLAVVVLPVLAARWAWKRASPEASRVAGASGPPPRDVAQLTAGFAAPAAQLVRTDAPTRSHLGGSPRLPAGRFWPEWRGRRLDFLARLSLPELQAVRRIDWLPDTGALLFFYDTENQPWGFDPADRGSCVVLHVADEERSGASRDEPERFARIDVGFRCLATLPSRERKPASDLKLTDAESDAYETLRDAVYGGQPKHQVGGLPFPIQGDAMELECQLASNGLYCGDGSGYRDPRAQSLAAGAKDWRLLLQFDTDDEIGLMWGDCGTVYIWVREQDAVQGRFDDSWLILQCS